MHDALRVTWWLFFENASYYLLFRIVIDFHFRVTNKQKGKFAEENEEDLSSPIIKTQNVFPFVVHNVFSSSVACNGKVHVSYIV